MKKSFAMFMILLILMSFTGCNFGKDYEETVESHPAFESYKEGEWEVRYLCATNSDNMGGITEVRIILSVDVNREMTKKQMTEILDYFELTRNARFENGEYKGNADAKFICYAVFYQGDTDEELWKVKWDGKEECEITKDDEGMFAKPQMCSSEDEKGGEWP